MRTIAFASALRHQLRGSDPLPDMRRLLETRNAALKQEAERGG